MTGQTRRKPSVPALAPQRTAATHPSGAHEFSYRSIRQLIQSRLGDFDPAHRWLQFEQVFRYQGKQLDTVLAADETIVGGIRYGSLLEKLDFANRNVLAKHVATPLGEELRSIGKTLWQSIPENIRTGVVFTVDGVLDSDGRLWLLEMNPNPTVHPDVYAAMLRDVLAKKVSEMPSLAGDASKESPAMRGGLVWQRDVPTK